MGYVDNILMEIDRYDLRQKDVWNPLYDPKKEKKSSYGIELDTHRVGFGNETWFDTKNPSPVFVQQKRKMAVENIHQDLINANKGVQTSVDFLNQIIKANKSGALLDYDILKRVSEVSPTIVSIYKNFMKLWPKDLNNMEFKFAFEDLIREVISNMSKLRKR